MIPIDKSPALGPSPPPSASASSSSRTTTNASPVDHAAYYSSTGFRVVHIGTRIFFIVSTLWLALFIALSPVVHDSNLPLSQEVIRRHELRREAQARNMAAIRRREAVQEVRVPDAPPAVVSSAADIPSV